MSHGGGRRGASVPRSGHTPKQYRKGTAFGQLMSVPFAQGGPGPNYRKIFNIHESKDKSMYTLEEINDHILEGVLPRTTVNPIGTARKGSGFITQRGAVHRRINHRGGLDTKPFDYHESGRAVGGEELRRHRARNSPIAKSVRRKSRRIMRTNKFKTAFNGPLFHIPGEMQGGGAGRMKYRK
jgi:hypothetical protein